MALTLGAAGLAGAALLALSQQQGPSPDVGPSALLWNPPTGVMTQGPSPTAPSPTPTATPTPNATGYFPIPAVTAATVSAASGPYATAIQTIEAAVQAAPTGWWAARSEYFAPIWHTEYRYGQMWWPRPDGMDDLFQRIVKTSTPTPTMTPGGSATPTDGPTATPTRAAKVQGYFSPWVDGLPEGEDNMAEALFVVTFADGDVPFPTKLPIQASEDETPSAPLDIPGSAPTPEGALVPVNPLLIHVGVDHQTGDLLLRRVGFNHRGYFRLVEEFQHDRAGEVYFVPR